MKRRPVGVTVLAVLAIIYGALQLLGGLSLIGVTLFAVPGLEVSAFLESIGIAAGVVSLILAAAFIVFGVGALGLRTWSWTLGVSLFGIMVLASIVGMFTGQFTAGLVVAAVLFAVALVYLLTDDVRDALGHHRGVMGSTGRPATHA